MASWNDIRWETDDFWDEDNLSLSLFVYRAGESETDFASLFVREFKSFNEDCIKEAVAHVFDALEKHAENLEAKLPLCASDPFAQGWGIISGIRRYVQSHQYEVSHGVSCWTTF